MESQPEYEYKTVPVDSRPRKQIRELKKLAKEGWEVISVRPGTFFSDLSSTSDALLRRARR
ncbi:DUF4177 domain-containing protein [Arthrobacter sp. SLBN-112]|jgi:hypothetical protein|uniref:DUF4177 domain-containing protein n=1 Tax=Arthrobacter sp. SLBN-112 TaxID=2768452 RepID=UPI0027B19EF3|nr:DUF4177 domain-containing protein [Arthrobacter sp. SLBN-112]MDQ0798918.1 hypothetical protein [Arthrobacter sp. SLBN-112]